MKKNKKLKITALMLILVLFSTTFSADALQSKNNYLKQDMVNSKDNVEINNVFSEEVYDLLIIAPQAFSRYILPLVHHKNKFGVKTTLVDVEDVYQQMYWHGRDKAEKIKYFIKKAIAEDGTIYVGSDDGSVYFGGTDGYHGYLYALNPDGTEKWKIDMIERIPQTRR